MKIDHISERITLKDGSEALIRSTRHGDVEALAGFFKSLPKEDRLFLRDDVTRPDFVEGYVRRFDYDRMIPIVAEKDGQVVAEGSLYRTHHGWTSHLGVIRVAVARALQRQGLGMKMIQTLAKTAMNLGLEKIVAEVVSNQVSAKKALEKLGFHHEATLKDHAKGIHGLKRDMLVMSKDLSQVWDAMEDQASEFKPTVE